MQDLSNFSHYGPLHNDNKGVINKENYMKSGVNPLSMLVDVFFCLLTVTHELVLSMQNQHDKRPTPRLPDGHGGRIFIPIYPSRLV